MKHFKKTLSLLTEKLPPAFPVDVKRVALKAMDGFCSKQGEKFVIRIDKTLEERMATETLLHEWAHALRWDYRLEKMTDEEFMKNIHDASWGVYYAEIYRCYLEHMIINA